MAGHDSAEALKRCFFPRVNGRAECSGASLEFMQPEKQANVVVSRARGLLQHLENELEDSKRNCLDAGQRRGI